MAIATFLDTSVLLAGLIDFGTQSAPSQSLLHAVSERHVREPGTAWHCCLEFYSVATRLPAEYRLSTADAHRLLEEEIFGRMAVHDLPAADRLPMLRTAASVVVTDNRRHFLSALRHGMRVETPAEFLGRQRTRAR